MSKQFLFLFLLATVTSHAQKIYNKPLFDKTVYNYTKIEKVVVDDEKTLVYLLVDNPNSISNDDSWYTREIHTIKFYFLGEKSPKALVLQDDETKKIYKQIKSKESNMPRGTSQKDYVLLGQEKKEFIIAFEKLDSTVKKINFLDGGEYNWNNKGGTYWHIYGLNLMDDVQKNNFLLAKAEKEKQDLEERNKREIAYNKQQSENAQKEKERMALIKSQIENGTFTGSHFYDYNEFKYTGSFVNGIPNGQGKWEKPDGSWYEGSFKDGVENGRGTLRQTSGLRYTGNFTNGVPNGQFKIEQWTLMGLSRNEWQAEYQNGKLISSTQTNDGMDKLFSGNSTSSTNNSNQTETPSKKCEWKLKSSGSNNAEFENESYGTKKVLWEFKKEGIDGSFKHYLISGTSYLGTEVKYYYANGGDVITTGGTKLGIASTINEACILLLKQKFCN